MRLLSDRVLIQIDKPERLSASKLLHLPASARRQPHELYRGKVLATGPGKRRKDGRLGTMEVRPGDSVMFYWAAGLIDVTELIDGDSEMRIIREADIQAVLS